MKGTVEVVVVSQRFLMLKPVFLIQLNSSCVILKTMKFEFEVLELFAAISYRLFQQRRRDTVSSTRRKYAQGHYVTDCFVRCRKGPKEALLAYTYSDHTTYRVVLNCHETESFIVLRESFIKVLVILYGKTCVWTRRVSALIEMKFKK